MNACIIYVSVYVFNSFILPAKAETLWFITLSPGPKRHSDISLNAWLNITDGMDKKLLCVCKGNQWVYSKQHVELFRGVENGLVGMASWKKGLEWTCLYWRLFSWADYLGR